MLSRSEVPPFALTVQPLRLQAGTNTTSLDSQIFWKKWSDMEVESDSEFCSITLADCWLDPRTKLTQRDQHATHNTALQNKATSCNTKSNTGATPFFLCDDESIKNPEVQAPVDHKWTVIKSSFSHVKEKSIQSKFWSLP